MKHKPTPTHSPSQLAQKLWDGILKSMMQHMPEQFFPLFKHVFGIDYPKDAPLELLSTEYSAPGKSNPGKLSAIFADIVMRVAGTDIYHLEGQMKKDTCLSFRMFEYDTHIALSYGTSEESRTTRLTGHRCRHRRSDADAALSIFHYSIS